MGEVVWSLWLCEVAESDEPKTNPTDDLIFAAEVSAAFCSLCCSDISHASFSKTRDAQLGRAAHV